MSIEALSTDLAQSRLMDEVGASVLKMSMSEASDEAAALAKLIDTADQNQYADPNIGTQIDLLA